MSNETKQTAVEWLVQQLKEQEYLGVFCTPNAWSSEEEIMKGIVDKAKEMEKEQTNNAIKSELKLIGNYFDVSKLDAKEQAHHIRFTSILKDRFDFYNETYGGKP